MRARGSRGLPDTPVPLGGGHEGGSPSCKLGGGGGIVTFLTQTQGGPLAQPGWHRLVSDPQGLTDIRVQRLLWPCSPGPALPARPPPSFVLAAKWPAAVGPGAGAVKGGSPSTPSLAELPKVCVGGIIPGPVLGPSQAPSSLVLDTGAQTHESLGPQRTADRQGEDPPPGAYDRVKCPLSSLLGLGSKNTCT